MQYYSLARAQAPTWDGRPRLVNPTNNNPEGAAHSTPEAISGSRAESHYYELILCRLLCLDGSSFVKE